MTDTEKEQHPSAPKETKVATPKDSNADAGKNVQKETVVKTPSDSIDKQQKLDCLDLGPLNLIANGSYTVYVGGTPMKILVTGDEPDNNSQNVDGVDDKSKDKTSDLSASYKQIDMASASSGQNVSYSDTEVTESSISDGKIEISYEEFKKGLDKDEEGESVVKEKAGEAQSHSKAEESDKDKAGKGTEAQSDNAESDEKEAGEAQCSEGKSW